MILLLKEHKSYHRVILVLKSDDHSLLFEGYWLAVETQGHHAWFGVENQVASLISQKVDF